MAGVVMPRAPAAPIAAPRPAGAPDREHRERQPPGGPRPWQCRGGVSLGGGTGRPLIAVAHDRGIPVIFSTVIYNDADLKDAGIWALKQKGVVTLKGDSDGVEVDPRLDFRKSDS